jgi:fructose-1-phosphate kinase PfkB-like protein
VRLGFGGASCCSDASIGGPEDIIDELMMRSPLTLLAMSSPTAVIVGLNGALQKRFILPEQGVLVPGNVHRAQSVQTGVGGKGQDVAIALNCLSSESNINLAQFVGAGSSGDEVYGLLVDTLGESAMSLTVRVHSEMRTCTSIVASDETTELVEPSGFITDDERMELMNNLQSTVPNNAAALCIMGSMPPGCPSDTYAQIYSHTVGLETLCLVDSVAGVESLLQTIASMEKSGPTVFKLNASELCNLAGCKKNKSEAGGVELSELTTAVSQFLQKFSPAAIKALRGLAITDGRHPGYFVDFGKEEFSLFRLPIPVLESGRTLYPIGAGDAVAGGTLAAWLYLTDREQNTAFVSKESHEPLGSHFQSNEGVIPDPGTRTIVSAFAFGLACGSASKCERPYLPTVATHPLDRTKLLSFARLSTGGKFRC